MNMKMSEAHLTLMNVGASFRVLYNMHVTFWDRINIYIVRNQLVFWCRKISISTGDDLSLVTFWPMID